MATQAERSVVYAAGVAQGIALRQTVYAVAAVIAAALDAWSFVVAGRRPSPASLHPQPG